MPRFRKRFRLSRPRSLSMVLVATAGFVVAALVGVALGRTFTLSVAKNATVMSAATGKRVTENIVVNPRGLAVYDLTGDSKRHPECTKGNGCFQFWPPVTVASPKKLSKSAGINGKLGTWRRNGFWQVTLAGHPLYRFSGDTERHVANGEALQTFGGTWHVIKASNAKSTTTTTTTTSSGSTHSSSTTSCMYPPYC